MAEILQYPLTEQVVGIFGLEVQRLHRHFLLLRLRHKLYTCSDDALKI